MIRVQVFFEPTLYREVLANALERTGSIEVVTDPDEAVDVVIFPLSGDGQLQACLTPELPHDAKLIAASANGDRALIWLPGGCEWTEVRPFGLDELVREVLAGRDCRAARPEDLPTTNKVDQIPH